MAKLNLIRLSTLTNLKRFRPQVRAREVGPDHWCACVHILGLSVRHLADESDRLLVFEGLDALMETLACAGIEAVAVETHPWRQRHQARQMARECLRQAALDAQGGFDHD